MSWQRNAIAVTIPVLLVGCSMADPDEREARDYGRALLDQQTRVAGHFVGVGPREALSWIDVDELASTQDRTAGRIELLDYDIAEPDHPLAVVRVHVEVPPRQATGFSTGRDGATWERCYRVDLHPYADTSPDEVRCPAEAEPLRIPDFEPTVIDAAIQHQMRRWLRHAAPTSYDASDLQAGLPDGLTAEAATDGRSVGLVVVNQMSSCLVGRSDGQGKVEIWSPPLVYQQPGEGGCSADYALDPFPAPH